MQAPSGTVETLRPCRAPALGRAQEAGSLRPSERRRQKAAGVTLIELLCVCVIIAILTSMLLPALSRAYRRAKAMQEEFEDAAVFEMLLKATRNYCAANPKYSFGNKNDFAEKCGLPSKCKDWIYASPTEFIPFDNLAPTNLVVLTFHYGPKYRVTRAFSMGEIVTRPQD